MTKLFHLLLIVDDALIYLTAEEVLYCIQRNTTLSLCTSSLVSDVAPVVHLNEEEK